MKDIELKRFLLDKINAKYTDEEIKQIPEEVFRDLYLKKLYAGEIEGTLKGNLYLDKPWVQYFLDNPVEKITLKETLYNNYINATKDHLDEIAIYAHNTSKGYTHREIIELANKLADSLNSMGYGKNSRVGLLVNNSLEEPIFLLALSKIGALAKFIDYTKDIGSIKHNVDTSEFDFIVMEEFLLPMEQFINENKLPVVVVNNEGTYEQEHFVTFKDLISKKCNISVNAVSYEDKKATIIINSSGTTGEPKPIVHTDYSINMSALKMLYTDFNLGRNNVIMKIIPPQIGLGLITTLYTNLIAGTKIALIEARNPEESIGNTIGFVKNFNEFKKVNNLDENTKLIIFGAPMYFRALLAAECIEDLSFVGGMLAAGSKMGEEELKLLDSVLKSKGCEVSICNGYGQNEMGGAVTLNSNTKNKFGSAGYPTIGTDIRIIDVKTEELLKGTEEGIILERTGSSFLEYEGLEDATNNSKIQLQDSLKWFNTNDLGYMDEEGFQYITGRLSRVFIRCDFKIAIDGIEEKIKLHPAVKDCAIVPINKGDSEDLTFAYISLNPGFDKSIETIVEEIQFSEHPISELEMPSSFEELQDIPYMNNGKVNYIELMEKSKAKIPGLENLKRTLNKTN